ncbi:hypothetical protein SDC9_140258 [bioreactor metagenome]|uniref:Uncharacterized protein n=1 Tax=bioreactor metagenome TaxID=1076179 RepID=A0A645DXR4_9ZZZZ
MTKRVVSGSVDGAGGGFSHALPLHPDGLHHTPDLNRLDTEVTPSPVFSQPDSFAVMLAW